MDVQVVAVEALPEYLLRVTFSDGVETEVDLSRDLRGTMTEPLKAPEYFARAFVDEDAGTVAWPNGYDLDPVVLHGDLPASAPSALTVKRLAERSA